MAKCPFPPGAFSGNNQTRVCAALESQGWARVTRAMRDAVFEKHRIVLYSGSAECVLLIKGDVLAEVGMWSVRIGQVRRLTTNQGAQHNPSTVTLIEAIEHSKVTGSASGFANALQGKSWRDA